MISAIGFAPMPPLLRPEVAAGAALELDDLRAAVAGVVASLSEAALELVVLTPQSGKELGEWILHRADITGAEFVVVPDDVEQSERKSALTRLHQLSNADSDIALLVMGDGSACRSLKAPGYLDERSQAFDQSVEDALRAGDSHTLANLDTELGKELLVAGRATWPIVGELAADQSWEANLLTMQDPYGVAYFVALWRNAGIPSDTV